MDETFEFTVNYAVKLEIMEEQEKYGDEGEDWQRAWLLVFNGGIPRGFTELAAETAKKAVSTTYKVPIDSLKVDVSAHSSVVVVRME